MKIRELLNENKETTKKIREFFKKRFGLTTKDVSVKLSRGNSIEVTIKSVKALPYLEKIENISKKHENVRYDEFSNEILSGGNTFVFVDLDRKLEEKIVEKLQKALEENDGEIKIGKAVLIHDKANNRFRLEGDGVFKVYWDLFGIVDELIKYVSKKKSTLNEFLKIIK